VAPGHLYSIAALDLSIPTMGREDPRVVDSAIARAIALTRAGRHRDAAQIYRDAVVSTNAPNAGWILPVEPILHTARRPEIWREALAIVQQRAT
jgi:hypothetical protein